MKTRKEARHIRHLRIRKKIHGSALIPRLAVFSSNKHFIAQIIDDSAHNTLASFSTLQLKEKMPNNKKTASLIGKKLGEIAKTKKITKVVFDRGGFLFHGKIKAFADEIKKEGVIF